MSLPHPQTPPSGSVVAPLTPLSRRLGRYVVPVLLAGLLCRSVESSLRGGFDFPAGGIAFGWTLALVSVAPTPIVAWRALRPGKRLLAWLRGCGGSGSGGGGGGGAGGASGGRRGVRAAARVADDSSSRTGGGGGRVAAPRGGLPAEHLPPPPVEVEMFAASVTVVSRGTEGGRAT